MERYEAHGSFHYERIEDVLVIKVQGAWNLECAKAYIAFAESYYQQTHAVNLVLLIDVSKLEGMTPEAASMLNRYNGQCKDRGMFKSQIYFAKSSKIMLQMALSLLKLNGSDQKAFKSIEPLKHYMSKDVSEAGLKQVVTFLSLE